MTKAKKVTVKVTKTTVVKHDYEIRCPHCKTHLQAYYILPEVLRIKCARCEKPIELDWETPHVDNPTPNGKCTIKKLPNVL